ARHDVDVVVEHEIGDAIEYRMTLRVGAEDHRAPDGEAVMVDALDRVATVAAAGLQVELLVEELEGLRLDGLEAAEHPDAGGLGHPVQDLVVLRDVDGCETEPVLADPAFGHLTIQGHRALVGQPAVPVEVLVAPDHAAILAFELLELVQQIVDRALPVLAALEERDEAELAGVRAAGRRDRGREAIAVFPP